MSRKPPRLRLVERVDLPVVEASGLAARRDGDQLRVVAVGDRTAHVAVASYDEARGLRDWQVIDLSEIDGWDLPPVDSQIEAITVDGGSLVALMREDPPVVIVADTGERRVLAHIELTVPDDFPFDLGWDDPSSRGEGLVMLHGGRLLVAKEKRPAALVEFCPPGVAARGVGAHDLLTPDERWEAPSGSVRYVASAAWRLKGRAKRTFADISDLAVGVDRTLWLLSDKSGTLGQLRLDEPLAPSSSTIRDVDAAWRLPDTSGKPEGIVALGNRRALVALDTDRAERNGIVVEPRS